MKKAADAFRSIGEVSQLVGVAPHVLRYWESQFPLFTPVKRRDGRRYFRPDDIRLAAGLCEILREEGMSIRGAKKQMAADRGAALKARGAARLGGTFAEEDTTETGITASPAQPVARKILPDQHPASDMKPAPEKDGSKARADMSRKRKPVNVPETLPLFPELDLLSNVPDESAPPAAAPKMPDPDWLMRLLTINTDLRTVSMLPRDEGKAILARLTEARRLLAA
ncbi:MAG: MerR family transcriptional regulator [Paracoccus sp. (in: a-proteobacteria)]